MSADFISYTVAFKVCKKCKESKQVTEFRVEKRTKSGFQAQCKACESAYAKTPAQREKRRVKSAELRATPERKAYMQAYAKQPHIYKKSLEASNARYQLNPEKVRATNDAWRRANPERKKAINADWNRRNKPLKAAYLARYRARKLHATPKWADIDAIKEIYDRAAKLGMHVDHVIPLRGRNVCGLHVHDNLQLLTPSENQSKGNKWIPI